MMQFDSWADFFAMGGHGLYVWLAYGATLLVLLGSYTSVRVARRSLLEDLRWSQTQSNAETNAESEEETTRL